MSSNSPRSPDVNSRGPDRKRRDSTPTPKEGKFYVGSTDNLNRRLNQHKAKHTQTTRNMKEPILVFSQEYKELRQARKIERKIKELKRKDYIEKIVSGGYIKMKIE
ncbi:hypothetical protein COV40_01255 [Candidatus Berkelbacteria bacterium CG11_big_fil_rev_8_21_14_0_20_42_15]|uniref:GIY-YIG domain-containing protein n=2 Tax=Candidatus Berkelbacteria TaxID=1618330 RepID=A0A2H0PZA0_9BACT|nr:MAG: hypothetical protein COV40_01255 [Candidatus Berkelbacteria bacterium CG11_big_fil_rev_8_21_14_0_20_42_15]PIZ27705.1 MAG: hypothetical protein COY45_01055 [Candidatus Berkelbacteria bacterium CG_4_10_14_0_8_um_filter_42_34]